MTEQSNGTTFTVLGETETETGSVKLVCRSEYLPGGERHDAKDYNRRGVWAVGKLTYKGKEHTIWLGYVRQNDVAALLSDLKKVTVTDERHRGYYCVYCKSFSENPNAFALGETVVLKNGPAHFNGLIRMLVNEHYDGCQGWE